MLLKFYKVHIKNRTQTPTHQQKFVFCKLFKLCKNIVKNILLGLFGGFFTRLIFFYTFFLLVWFFYSNIIVKLDFGYNFFVLEVIMFLISNILLLVRFFYTKYYLKNSHL